MSTLTSVDELNFGLAVPRPTAACEPISDHALLEASRAGDEAAFAELVRRYRDRITSYICRMTGDYDGAVDLAQETFVRVFRAAERYRTDYAFSTYIYRIATNLAISEMRKRHRRRVISLTGLFRGGGNEAAREEAFDVPDARTLQDAELIEAERRRAVTRAIATLPERYRAPLVLRDIEGKCYEEIAGILDTNEGTIKSRISRARALLRDKLRAHL